jgi:hypothetical protein
MPKLNKTKMKKNMKKATRKGNKTPSGLLPNPHKFMTPKRRKGESKR